jgi:hypothetical protein
MYFEGMMLLYNMTKTLESASRRGYPVFKESSSPETSRIRALYPLTKEYNIRVCSIESGPVS